MFGHDGHRIRVTVDGPESSAFFVWSDGSGRRDCLFIHRRDSIAGGHSISQSLAAPPFCELQQPF